VRGYAGRLFLLAFDHRSSFTRDLFGIKGEVSKADTARISDAKSVIYEGFRRALERGAPRDAAGVLVDEQYGADIARRATADGVMLAMPVEASGRKDFDFDYGNDFGAHIERFDPTFSKVLVRYNPDDPQGNAAQTQRLKRLSDWLHAHDRRFLFELLVPATDAQLAAVGGDSERYDRELRPTLMVRAIRELQQGGVEPDIWKIEGLATSDDCRQVAEQARSDGREHVACVVLGRGADEAQVMQWLRTAASVPGFAGFAVGRTIWQQALEGYRDGSLDRVAAAERIADEYLLAVETFKSAAG